MRVLIVEDDREVARQIETTLQQAGYVVDSAHDGEDGHFLGDTGPYDAVVLDLGLPVVDGLTVLNRWRADERKAAELARALTRAAASGTGQVTAHQAASLARKLSEGQAADEARPVPEFPSEVHIPTSSRPLTPERQELIRRALEVHREKSKILDDLPQDVRDRLTALALRTFLHPPPPKKRQN